MEWSNTPKGMKDMDTKTITDVPLLPFVEPLDVTPEKRDASSAPKPKKKSMTSLYLKFFETAPNGKSRRCRFCKQSYSIATATGNLGRHLNIRHPGYDKLGNSSQQALEDSLSSKSPLSLLKPATEGDSNFDHLNWLLLKWYIGASISPSVFEDVGFLNSLKFLNSSVTLWSSDKFEAVSLEVFRAMREDVKTLLERISSKVSITLDFFTSHEELNFMFIYCHWIDENWSLHKVLLDLRHIPYPSTGSEIYHAIVEILRMYNLEKKVLSCTIDNSQQTFNACHSLKEELESRKVPFCFIPCAAHALNQIIEDGLRSPKPILSKIREFALELNKVSGLAQDFKQLATIYQEGSWKFPLDTSATWNGNYAMLDLVWKASNSMDSTIKKHEEIFGGRNLLLNSTEKSVVDKLHSYLEPFHKITSNLSTCKVATVGLILFFVDHVFELISTCKDACRHDWLKSIADDMANQARGFSSRGYNLFTYTAAVLDPRLKKELIPEKLNSDKNLEEAKNHFKRHYGSCQFPSMANGFSSQDPEEENVVSFAEEIARKRRRVTTNAAADELSQYLSEPLAPFATDVLEWWKVNSSRYPQLSAMARDYLAVQGTSIDPDELFSSKGDRIRKQKFCLSHGSLQAVMCINSWSQSGFKFKFKSSEINFEKQVENSFMGSENSKC
ncbi:hypothetical protein KFK09_003390 [Dendrobium nobile]|uniref:Transposase n=1 Tax=Dendrobium nobile TaxID=94219 RepID=A0A8T3BXL1_DENNO|nr:hypothetical protein KFK09_003390 [Dendrobium nobile]